MYLEKIGNNLHNLGYSLWFRNDMALLSVTFTSIKRRPCLMVPRLVVSWFRRFVLVPPRHLYRVYTR